MKNRFREFNTPSEERLRDEEGLGHINTRSNVPIRWSAICPNCRELRDSSRESALGFRPKICTTCHYTFIERDCRHRTQTNGENLGSSVFECDESHQQTADKNPARKPAKPYIWNLHTFVLVISLAVASWGFLLAAIYLLWSILC